jgi:serine protease AprX
VSVTFSPSSPVRREAWGLRWLPTVLVALLLGFAATAVAAGQTNPDKHAKTYKSDDEVLRRKGRSPQEVSSVIVTFAPGEALPPEFKRFARVKGRLGIINGEVLDLPNGIIAQLERHPQIFRIHHNRPIKGHNYRTSLTTGSRAAQRGLGLTGAGIGIAILDSGVAAWHDDLTNGLGQLYPFGNQRVSAFVDFVNGRSQPYDDEGHGTHVAGIIAGNGYDSNGDEAGAAPDASLVSLKVLDAHGGGTISNVIAALDWVLANRVRYNIRVVNMSIGASINESYETDPLTLAAKRVVDAGVVVVGAAGNRGKNAEGLIQYGGITAPGNAPWVLTVGASSTNGTPDRGDDTVASFSSRGPSYIDYAAKPDLLAPGHGTVSLADPLSAFYTTKAPFLLGGSLSTAFKPYLTLSGTSMAAPVVAGTVALMLQANPSLTPNGVKAILQYTAQEYAGYDALTEGAGFLNTVGAVRLAQFFATAGPGQPLPLQKMWSKKIIWGNHQLSGGILNPTANAYKIGTTWGATATAHGDNIVWGTICSGGCDNIVWGTGGGDNIVWGTHCGGGDCDNIAWGTGGGDNIVWGTHCGGSDCDNIVWGTDGRDNIVWGTGGVANIVWGTDGRDNIVWGTDGGDNIVWGTDGRDNIVWGTDGGDNIVWGTVSDGRIAWSMADGSVSPLWWRGLFGLTDEQIFTILSTGTVNPQGSQLLTPVTTIMAPIAPTTIGVAAPQTPLEHATSSGRSTARR